MSTRIARIAIATTILAGLIATGCSSADSEQSADPGSATESSVETPTKAERPVITGNPTTTTTAAPVVVSSSTPAPPPTPAPTPAPTPTLGEPPVSVPPTFVTLVAIDFSLFIPRVETITSISSLTCLDAALLGFHVEVSWNAINTSQVKLLIDDVVVATGLPASGQYLVPLSCGDVQTVTVTALWPDGADGVSKTFKIKVAAF